MFDKETLQEYNLNEEAKNKLMEEIKYYFEQERDEKIGIIASEKLLHFFLDTLGKHIYNKALDDIKKWFDSNMENIETDFYAKYKY